MEMKPDAPGAGNKPHHLAFECEDLDKFRKDLIAKGLISDVPEIKSSHNGLRLFELKDPDGIRVQFFQGRAGFDRAIKSTTLNFA